VTAGVVLALWAAIHILAHPGLQAGAGTAAHNLCSSIFVSRLPEQQTEKEMIGLLVGPTAGLLRYRIDRDSRTVEATLLSAHARAVFTPGYGCRLDFGHPAPALPPVEAIPFADDAFAPPGLVQTDNATLRAALDREFEDAPGAAPRRVKAVVIVKDGHVVAERYADGFGIAAPMMSFSVAKSFTNALLGILVRQGRIDMDQPAAVPEWRRAGDQHGDQSGDQRGKITSNDLLRMASGLDAAESGSGFDPASQMFYNADDMGAYGAARPARRPAQSEWEYTSVNTLILDREIHALVGGGAPELRRFAEKELFAPLGMRNVTLEFDGAGTFLGASHVYAPAREFARFGLLYLNDGVAPDGRRILPEGWVAYSRKSTLGSPYGAGFWTNDGPGKQAAWLVAHGFPKDGFFASGNLGQRIYIIPSERMVVTRFGYSNGPDFAIEEDMALLSSAIAALKSPGVNRP